MRRLPPINLTMSPGRARLAAGLMVVAIGWFDFWSGAELRVFPLYYAPISLLAWNAGRSGAVASSLASALVWVVSNSLAGMRYSSADIWVANAAFLAFSFMFVGLLIATLGSALTRERELSRTDSLTSLHNRRAFYEEGGRILALCRRKSHPVALAFMDLDNFKAVNDKLGHEAGDELLRKVAGILRTSTRPSDLVARFGGDEFAVLLPEADASEARTVLERLRRLVAEGLVYSTIPVTCSLGALVSPTAIESIEAMVSAADSRMYVAKAGGKNRLHLEVAGAERSDGAAS